MKKRTDNFDFILPLPDSFKGTGFSCGQIHVFGVAYKGDLEEGGHFYDHDLNELLYTDLQGRVCDVLPLIKWCIKFEGLEAFVNEAAHEHLVEHCFKSEQEHTDYAQDINILGQETFKAVA